MLEAIQPITAYDMRRAQHVNFSNAEGSAMIHKASISSLHNLPIFLHFLIFDPIMGHTMSSNLGHDAAPEFDSHGNLISPFYGYMPTQWVCYIFCVLFILTTAIHFGQALRYRGWWLLFTVVLGGAGEIVGWVGRLWSTFQPLAQTPYMIQIVCTIIAPTPIIGAMFISFGRLSNRLGDQYSHISARLYSRLFITADIISLIVQASGGGIASAASGSTATMGSHIMLGGVAFQLVALSIFCLLATEYVFRYVKRRPARRLLANSDESIAYFDQLPMNPSAKRLLIGLWIESTLIFMRSVYRTIELADGFNGRIIQTEVYFNVLDGTMVFLTLFTMHIFHPARILKQMDEQMATESSIKMTSKDSRSGESA